jgi:hypothetical protein
LIINLKNKYREYNNFACLCMGVKHGLPYEETTGKGVREERAEEDICALAGGCKWRMGKLKHEELILQITVVKSRRMRWEDHVARMVERINAYKILVG